MKIRHVSLAAVAFGLFATPLQASIVSGIDAMKEWNLITLGDLQSSSEVEGRTFVGGDLTGNSSNYQISNPGASANGEPGLTVVGNVTGGTKNLDNGSGAVVGGNVDSGFNLNGAAQTVQVGGTISNTNVNQNTVKSGLAASDSTFSSDLAAQKGALTSSLTSLSSSMSQMTANSQVSFSGGKATFNAQPDASGTAVFNISASDLANASEIAFNLNGADTAIVNVSGSSANLDQNFLGGTTNLGEHVIWNFPDASTLNLSTAWGGSILAPTAAATTSNYVQGSAVFASLVQNGEFHLGTYEGSYTPPPSVPSSSSSGGGAVPVPEPGSVWLFLVATVGMIALLTRRRRKAGA